jgi:peptidoglycan/LPS O-acetylase OafA/YrhL
VFGPGLLVLALCREGPNSNLLFGIAVVLWMGNITFSLYIFRWMLIQISQCASSRLFLSENVQTGNLVAAIVLCTMALHQLVKPPSKRYLRKKMHMGGKLASIKATE